MPRPSRPLYTWLVLGGNGLVLAAGLTALAVAAPSSAAARPLASHARPVHVLAAMSRPAAVVRPAAARPAIPATTRSAPHRARRLPAARPHRAPAAPAPRRRLAAVRTDASSWSAALTSAVGRIPGYSPGAARWIVSAEYGSWGTADWYHGAVYISPGVPRERLYDVTVHEWSHLLSVAAYGGDVSAATAAMNGWFGGSGLTGAERAADCMALELGARWTHYTACADRTWRAGAARLVRKEQL